MEKHCKPPDIGKSNSENEQLAQQHASLFMEKSSANRPGIHNLGQHLLAEFYECNQNILNNVQKIEEIMVNAAIECGATVVTKNFHMFSPFGVSGVVIIQESHLAIHTWPEYGYAAVDLFTCGDSCDPKVAYDFLQEQFHAGSAFYSELKRGLLSRETLEVIEQPFSVAKELHTTAEDVASTPAMGAQTTAEGV